MNEHQPSEGYTQHPTRRGFLKAGLVGGIAATIPQAPIMAEDAPPAPPEVAPVELDELSIADLQNGMKSGKYTARSLTEKYLARIEAIDKKGPALRSVIETNPDALAIADALDRER